MQAFLEGINLKIQELAQKTGVTVYTIRFYEKQGLLDSRHFVRENNNYRNYSDRAIERLKFVKKFQGVGCSLIEIKDILQEKDENVISNQQVIEWIRHKISEIEQKKNEYDQIIEIPDGSRCWYEIRPAWQRWSCARHVCGPRASSCINAWLPLLRPHHEAGADR